MATDRRHSAASQEWWDQYNLGRMGVYTGSIASELGIQHRRVPAGVPAAPVAAPSKAFVAPAPVASVAVGQVGNPFRFVGKALFYFFGALAAFKMPEIVLANPGCLVSIAVIGAGVVLYDRCRNKFSGKSAPRALP